MIPTKKISKALLVTTLLASIFCSGQALSAAGKFLFVNGNVKVVDPSGKSHLTKKGDEVSEGDSVVTDSSGYAQIRMKDGGSVSVRPDTTIKIDSFNFNGKEDGSERSTISLSKGSVRAITGLVGKTHRENYKIQTATATIGVRGSGADIGHSDVIGTAVHTLFGGHVISSDVDGKIFTLETQIGQTALVVPGAVPHYVPSFPFSTVTVGSAPKDSADPKAADKSAADKPAVDKPAVDTSTTAAADKPVTTTVDAVNIPIKTKDNLYLSSSQSVAGIVGELRTSFVLQSDSSKYVYNFIDDHGLQLRNSASASLLSSSGVSTDTTLPQTTVFSALSFNNPQGENPVALTATVPVVFSGTSSTSVSDAGQSIPNADGTVMWGRYADNATARYIALGLSRSPTVNSLHYISVETGSLTSPTALGNLTGTAAYALVGSTLPTNELGSPGVLTSASAQVDFGNQKLTYNVAGVNASTPTAGFGAWRATGTGAFSVLNTGPGLPLAGTCDGGTCGSTATISGGVKGAFVGPTANGLMSAYQLSNLVGGSVTGVAYLKK